MKPLIDTINTDGEPNLIEQIMAQKETPAPVRIQRSNTIVEFKTSAPNVSGCRFYDTGLGDLYKTHNYNMENSYFERLLIEAQDLATKTNALNDFMRTQKFVDLDRQNKDLLYKKSRLMNEYLQVLGQRIELLGEKFSFKR